MRVAILSGSVFGTAERVASSAQVLLRQAGFEVWYEPQTTLAAVQRFAPQALLVVTSTTGQGELPENLGQLVYEARETFPQWRGLPGGIICLGDSSYQTFCQSGVLIHELFLELGVCELQEMLRLDACETRTPEQDAQPWMQAFQQKLTAFAQRL